MNYGTVPQHVAIIPDGNRRWAAQRSLKPWEGHAAGAERIAEIAEYAWDAGVTHMSFWGSSLENLTKRPLTEKKALLEIYEKYFATLFAEAPIEEKRIRINVVGRWREQLPRKLVEMIEEGMAKTKEYDGGVLTFFLAYSGDDEMIEAIKNIVVGGVAPEEITKETIKKNLWTRDLPPVDYLIRTGGEPHLSVGFMMWETANAQLYFTDDFFPDFDTEAFASALDEYARRARRHGA